MEWRRSVITGSPVPPLPSWLTEPLRDQFQALLPERPEFHPHHPLGCHRRRIGDRIVFDKMLQLLRFGCSYEKIADTTWSATTIRGRRDEWIRLGVSAKLKQIALESYDRTVGLVLDQIAVDGSITQAPGGGEAAGRSPVDRGKQGLKHSGTTDGYGIPLGRVLAGANRHDSPLLAPTLDRLNDLGPLPDDVTVHLDACYGSHRTRTLLNERGLRGHIARKREKAPIQASRRWHVERTPVGSLPPSVSPPTSKAGTGRAGIIPAVSRAVRPGRR
jgi:transposase